MKKIIIQPLFWIIVLSSIPLLTLFVPGLPFTHDGQDHVARIANFYQSLSEGNVIPRWAGNLNWGYGHPILMFLYPLPSYIASLFHFIGFSFVDSTKLVFAAAYIASGFTMFLWMASAFGKRAGIIGAILYTFAPYRFVDLYVRGAIGEHVAFVFPPLILYFLHQLAVLSSSVKRSRQAGSSVKYFIGASLSIAGLILSHNAISLMFLPVIGLYILYLYFYETNHSPYYFLLTTFSLLFGFGLSAFFWIPALFEGKYTLRDIVASGGAYGRFVPWWRFLYSPWNFGGSEDLSKFLGFAQWIGVILACKLFFNTKSNTLRTFLGGMLIFLLLSFQIMTDLSKAIWQNVLILQKFQFPWRFLSLSTFLSAVLGGISISSVIQMMGHRIINNKHIPLVAFCFLSIISTVYMWKPKAYNMRPDSFYSGIYHGTTDTGESSPIWSTRFMEKTPTAPMEVIDGNAVIMQKARNTTVHEYAIDAKSRTLLLENTLFFPGWNIYIDGNPVNVEYQNPNYRGLMTFYIDKGTHTVKVIFKNTKLRSLANAVSLISVAVLGLYSVKLIWGKK